MQLAVLRWFWHLQCSQDFAILFFSTPWECLLQSNVSHTDPGLLDSKLSSLLQLQLNVSKIVTFKTNWMVALLVICLYVCAACRKKREPNFLRLWNNFLFFYIIMIYYQSLNLSPNNSKLAFLEASSLLPVRKGISPSSAFNHFVFKISAALSWNR